MENDLRTIIDGWQYEPGKISVRKIVGSDGHEKIQTRVDMGILQFEPDGRPDGVRPYGRRSLLEYFEWRRDEHVKRHGDDDGFTISAEACRELRHEAHQYYQRYLSYFVLEEFDAVTRDAEHNLRTIDLCGAYAEDEYDQEALEPQRAYVVMMHARARTYNALADSRYRDALEALAEGIAELEQIGALPENEYLSEPDDSRTEIQVLHTLRDEVYQKMPANSSLRLQRELDRAIEREQYERAARLRDLISDRAEDESAS